MPPWGAGRKKGISMGLQGEEARCILWNQEGGKKFSHIFCSGYGDNHKGVGDGTAGQIGFIPGRMLLEHRDDWKNHSRSRQKEAYWQTTVLIVSGFKMQQSTPCRVNIPRKKWEKNGVCPLFMPIYAIYELILTQNRFT